MFSYKLYKNKKENIMPGKSLYGGCQQVQFCFVCEWKVLSIMFQVSKKNLMEIVKKLMVHMDKAEGTTYRDELLSKIIQICSQNNYQYITNFEW